MSWEVFLDKKDFNKIINEDLPHLLNLSRVVNTLNFCYVSGFKNDNKNKNSSVREVICAFTLMSGYIFEVDELINRMRERYKDNEIFKSRVLAVLKDKEFKKHKDKYLYNIRNIAAFHFSKKLDLSMIDYFNVDRYVFASSDENINGRAYYGLVDEILMNYFIGRCDNPEEEKKLFEELGLRTADIALKLIDGINEFIASELVKMGWDYKEINP